MPCYEESALGPVFFLIETSTKKKKKNLGHFICFEMEGISVSPVFFLAEGETPLHYENPLAAEE